MVVVIKDVDLRETAAPGLDLGFRVLSTLHFIISGIESPVPSKNKRAVIPSKAGDLGIQLPSHDPKRGDLDWEVGGVSVLNGRWS